MLQHIKKHNPRGSVLATAWHRLAPPIAVGRKYYGVKVFMDLRDCVDDLTKSRSELESREKSVLSVLSAVDGTIWDVGANIGLFAVRAALLDRRCIAFEQSEKACRLMERTRQGGRFSFEVVNRALTVDTVCYTPPASAYAGNQLDVLPESRMESLNYLEAAKVYGVPQLIKMDIEGGEAAFFRSEAFKSWVCQNDVAWLVELHTALLGYTPEWDDVPQAPIDSGHVLYASSTKRLEMLTEAVRSLA